MPHPPAVLAWYLSGVDPLAGSQWSASDTVAGFAKSAPNAVLMKFAEEELRRPGHSRALDLGCGAGAVMLCAAVRAPGLGVVGLERDASLAAVARANVAANGLDARAAVVEGDVAQPPPALTAGDFDHVLINPPYLDPAAADPSRDPRRRAANVEGDADLATWIATARGALQPGGTLTLIHRADRLDAVLAALSGFGATILFPLWPKAGRAAKRVILRARRDRGAGTSLVAGLVLHEADGRFTPAADAILRHAGLLALDPGDP